MTKRDRYRDALLRIANYPPSGIGLPGARKIAYEALGFENARELKLAKGRRGAKPLMCADEGEAAIYIAHHLAGSMATIGEPLSELQQTVMVGGLAIWLGKYAEEVRKKTSGA